MNIKTLKVDEFLKKKGGSIEQKIIEVGNDYVKLYNDVTGYTQTLIDLSNYIKV